MCDFSADNHTRVRIEEKLREDHIFSDVKKLSAVFNLLLVSVFSVCLFSLKNYYAFAYAFGISCTVAVLISVLMHPIINRFIRRRARELEMAVEKIDAVLALYFSGLTYAQINSRLFDNSAKRWSIRVVRFYDEAKEEEKILLRHRESYEKFKQSQFFESIMSYEISELFREEYKEYAGMMVSFFAFCAFFLLLLPLALLDASRYWLLLTVPAVFIGYFYVIRRKKCVIMAALPISQARYKQILEEYYDRKPCSEIARRYFDNPRLGTSAVNKLISICTVASERYERQSSSLKTGEQGSPKSGFKVRMTF